MTGSKYAFMNPVDKACPLVKAYISKKKRKRFDSKRQTSKQTKISKTNVLLKVKQAIGKERMNERLS